MNGGVSEMSTLQLSEKQAQKVWTGIINIFLMN